MASFTPVNTPGAYSAVGVNTTPVASSAGADDFVMGGKDLLIAENTDVGAQTVTVTSVDDAFNRKGDIVAHSIPANDWGIFGPFNPSGWRAADGNLDIASSSANVRWVILRIVD